MIAKIFVYSVIACGVLGSAGIALIVRNQKKEREARAASGGPCCGE